MKKIVAIVFLTVILSAATAGNFCYQLFLSRPAKDAPVTRFEVPAGASAAAVANGLKQQGLIKNAWLWRWYLRRAGLDAKIVPGVFELRPGLSGRRLAATLTDAALAEDLLVFIEGWTLREAGRYLENKGLFQAEELHESVGFPAVDYRWASNDLPALKDWSAKFDFLQDKPKYIGLEGYLFPDTYRVRRNEKLLEIVGKLLENFGKKLTPELRAEIKRQGKTIFQIVTLASLAEAEAREEKDRRLVADILWRRLAIGMPLQLDSTVNYILGTQKPAVTLKDREADSLYNTYRYAGLPLGPINSPGMNAILAAIYPEKNNYWFFLTGVDGKMYYASTLDEHNLNKGRYMK